MRLMAGLDAPTRGRILVDGRDVTGWPVQRRNVAMVYQQFINYPSLTVYENIASPLRVAGLPRARDRPHASPRRRSCCKLEPFLDRRPLQLSGGQQQRTAIARALVKRADLVLLDEPLANLDYKLREELREELPRIFAESGAIFVYATTEPQEALLLGGNTATLYEGRVTQFGPTPRSTAAPRPDDRAGLLRSAAEHRRGGEGGRSRSLSTGTTIPAVGVFRRAPDGRYTRRLPRPPPRVRAAARSVHRASRHRLASPRSPARKASCISRRRACVRRARRRRARLDPGATVDDLPRSASRLPVRRRGIACGRRTGGSLRGAGHGPHHARPPRPLLQGRARQARRTTRSRRSTTSGRRAAPTRCSARPAAARPRCSTSSPASSCRRAAACCSTSAT